ncbi:GumC family protein [Consotaella salsifontis]|uniref:Uncharacterized protein involved in exopolysaccharide biosynthesis n=1 Tax=Consotaella salsifontis TaxID=1365950 RepID=A0A1T4Q3E4_9HYPH|nr:GumC family protein [Consotaella salsifontis]SJZ98011.1 Uncharacterized protein involved in exopolysaccharide biosynthesis [Consotaella salsifontis]
MFTSSPPRSAAKTVPQSRVSGTVPVGQQGGSGRSLFDPVEFFGRVWSARPFVIGTTVLGAVVAAMVALSTPKIYEAASQILIDPRDLKVVQNEVTPNGLPSEASLALIDSQISVILSNSVLFAVVDEANLTGDPEFNGSAKEGLGALISDILPFGQENEEQAREDTRLKTIANLRDRLSAARAPKSFVITLSVKSEDPDKAARLANLVADKYLDEQARIQSDTARRATDALSSRLDELRKRVSDAESAVETYKAENQLIGVNGRLIDDDYIVSINNELARVRAQIASLQAKADSMRNADVDAVVKGAFPEELTSEALVRLRSSYADLAHAAASLSAKLGPRHPQRIAAEEALASARQAIAGELQRVVGAAQTELQRSKQTERDLTRQIDELKVRQVTNGEAFVRLRQLEREAEAARSVYEAFLLRSREIGEQEGLNTNNVRVISEATRPLDPASLSRKIVVILGAIIGFVAGLGLAIAWVLISMIRDVLPQGRDPSPAYAAATAAMSAQPVPEAAVVAPSANGRQAAFAVELSGPAAMEVVVEEPAMKQTPAPAKAEAPSPLFPEAKDDVPVQAAPTAPAAPVRPAAPAPSLGDIDLIHRRAARDSEPVRQEIKAAHPMNEEPASEPLPVKAEARKPSEDSASAGGMEDDIAALRARIHEIAGSPADFDEPNEEEFDAEMLQLHRDIAAVKAALAEIRRKRSGEASPSLA